MGALLAAAAAASTPAAVEVRRLFAPEAHQGVAADARSLYAVDNSTIARYDKANGRRIAAWKGDPALFKHINSCMARAGELVCAASNYPEVPMKSTALWFDAATLRLRRTRSIPSDLGSLTWLDWHHGHWWAGFANYDGKGGEVGRDHRQTVVVRYTSSFDQRAVYRFPANILERFAPHSTSGGAWNRDGLLYITGHDRAEVYAMRVPHTGDTLDHVATIATPTGGQAIAWDPSEARTLWSIERRSTQLVSSRVPSVAR